MRTRIYLLFHIGQCLRSNSQVHSSASESKDLIISSITSVWPQHDCARLLTHNNIFNGQHVLGTCHLLRNPSIQYFSTAIQPTLSWKVSSRDALLNKLETAMKHHQADEAYLVFNDFRSIHGFPNQRLMSKLITELCYSSDPRLLRKAYELVLLIQKEKSHLLHCDFLSRLALALARAQMPIPTSTILRVMIEKGKFPSVDTLSTAFLHMVKTPLGTYLACNLLIEVCDCLSQRDKRDLRVSKQSNLALNTMIVNLVLDACLRFDVTLKAQQIIQEVMPRVGIIADGFSIVTMALIYERNGQRDELKKLKELVDGVPVSLDHHYQHFYDSLLSIHLKFNDIDSASSIVLDVYRRRKKLSCTDPLMKNSGESGKTFLVPVGPRNMRTGLKIQIMPSMLKDSMLIVRHCPKFVICVDGNLVVTHKALAELVNAYVRNRRVGELLNIFISIRESGFPTEASAMSSKVIHAFIQLGWLDTAHDLLEDMESAAIPSGEVTYMSLMRHYCRANRFGDARVLVKQMRKAGFQINLSDEEIISSSLPQDRPLGSHSVESATSVEVSTLVKSLLQESREEESTSPLVYDINSSIYFFSMAKMMEDAMKSFQKMQRMKLQPTVQTFVYLVNGFSSLKMYRQVTILWGEIRRSIDDQVLAADWYLFECLLWNFIRGGYFEKVMEIINYMTKYDMYADKWKYRIEFLKFHEDLYLNLKASEAKTDAQRNRLEHVQAFRRWAGIEY